MEADAKLLIDDQSQTRSRAQNPDNQSVHSGMYRLGLASLRSTLIFLSTTSREQTTLIIYLKLISIGTIPCRDPQDIIPDCSSTFHLISCHTTPRGSVSMFRAERCRWQANISSSLPLVLKFLACDCLSSAGDYIIGLLMGSLQYQVWLIFCWLLNSFHEIVFSEDVRCFTRTSGLGRHTHGV